MPVNLGSWLGSTVSTVITPIYDTIITHAVYCFNTSKNVRDHERATQTLTGKRSDVQAEIDAARRNGLIATNEAAMWQERVDRAISEEVTNRARYDQRQIIFGCCSLNCWANYKISKRADEKLLDVNECDRSRPTNVTVKQPPPSVIDIPIQSIQLLNQESILRDALQCITNDPVGMIGIWGPDGVENTHLLKKINNSFVDRSPFDFVIFVAASRECSVHKIRAEIIQRLDIRQDTDVANQTMKISELLKTGSFLVLVDDLCEKLDLPAVGIPYPLGIIDQCKRKVVITSQSKTLCDLMDVKKYIELRSLEENEALQLFEQTVGQVDLYSDPDLGALAKDLVKELKGLPSELRHIGKIMQSKGDPRQWEDAISAVKKSNLQKEDPFSLTGKIVRKLEDATNKLLARSNDVRHDIKIAERKGKTYTNEVDGWLQKVYSIDSHVQIIFEAYKLDKDITMEAAEKLCEVQECLSGCPSIVAVESVPPPAREVPGPSMSSENCNLQEALRFIKDDPKGMIGIWGPGGVGKTHLVNNINNSFAGGTSFNVIFVTASRGCSVEKIQAEIVMKLELRKDGNVECQRQIIYDFLKRRSFLVLLDDLWDQIDLQAVGIPYPLGIVNQLKRKVVLTTRLRKVCGEMEVRKQLEVASLQVDEAWQLFQEKVGHETLSSSPRIRALARELVKELKGLPLALIVIGKAMSPKSDPAEWEYAIKHMQRSCCEKDSPVSDNSLSDGGPLRMGTVFSGLKFSYDSLRSNNLRNCFLTCALWPEDCKISKVDLAQCWMGLGLVDVDRGAIQNSYNKAYSLIGELRDACLLESWGNWYGFVKVHDVIRDMALWISCGCGENNDKWFVRAQAGTDNTFSIPWSKAEYISLMLNEMRKLPPFRFNPSPMILRVLCLQNNYLDWSIVETIKNFTSLTYLDLSINKLKNIPEELCYLSNLEYLDLSHNPEIYKLPRCFGNLVKLKFLYLLCTGIGTILEDVISNLKALQVIDLRTWRAYHGGSPVNYIPAIFRELATLPNLRAAGIEVDGFSEYESLSDAANLPIRSLILGNLKKTTAFSFSDIFSVDFMGGTLYDLEIIQSNMEQIIVRQVSGQQNYHFSVLNKLVLWFLINLKEITWMGRSLETIFPRLTCLDVNSCFKLEHLSWVMYLPCLEQLEARFCDNMKQAFLRTRRDDEDTRTGQGSSQTSYDTFPCLKQLCLSNNANLVTICDRDVTFPSLEQLVLTKCPELKRLPFQKHSLPKKLHELQLQDVQCWERLECEEDIKSSLQPTLKFDYESEIP